MTQLLMCPPFYFDIHYEINPWMDRRRPASRPRAWRQWRTLHEVLTKRLEVRVDLQEPAEGCPDLVFTANAGLVVDGKVILSRFRHPERQVEEPHDRAWFHDAGYQVYTLGDDVPFEGEGDGLLVDDRILLGHGIRTDLRAAERLATATGREVVPLELVDPWFYHLDTCLAPLGEGKALWYPNAFSPEAQQRLRGLFDELIAVSQEEALKLVCNAVVIGRDVVTSAGCPEATGRLGERGYRVHPVEMDQFMLAGGGAKCLVLFLQRPLTGPSPQ